jgi:hypothetical protein
VPVLRRRRSLRFAALSLTTSSAAVTTVLVAKRDAPYAALLAAIAVVIPTFLAAAVPIWQEAESSEGVSRTLAIAVKREWESRRFELLGGSTVGADLQFHERLGDGRSGDVLQCFRQTRHRRLVILGKPGSGKTLLAIDLLLGLLRTGGEPGVGELPVLLSVAGWDPREPFREWLAQRLVRDYDLSFRGASELVDAHRVLPILDGLDEFGDGADGRDRARRVLERLNSAVDGTRSLPLVITCRVDYYDQISPSLRLRAAEAVVLEDLGPIQLANYLSGRYPDPARNDAVDPNWQPVIARLRSKRAEKLQRVLATPWVLGLAATAYDAGRVSPPELLKFQTYKELRDSLLPEVIPSALVIHRPRVALYRSTEKVTSWLSRITQHMDGQKRRGKGGVEIAPRDLWQTTGSRLTRTVHAIFAVPGGALLGIVGAEVTAGPVGEIITSVFLLVGAAVGAWGAIDADPLPSRINLRRLRSWRNALIPALLGVWATVAGLLSADADVALVTGLAATVAGALIVGLRGGMIGALRPAEPITNDLIFGVALGLTGGIYVALPGGLNGGLLNPLHLRDELGMPMNLVLGLALGLIAGLSLGSRAFVRYAVAISVEALAGRLPWSLTRFMSWAHRAGLLRVYGTAYQFRHEDFKNWISKQTAARPTK